MRINKAMFVTMAAGVCVGSGVASVARAQTEAVDWLPDVIIREQTLYQNRILIQNGRLMLRLSNATPNIGMGKLQLYGSTVNGDGTQDVNQRIFRSDGTYWDRLAGKFVFHPGHNHIHFQDWCVYRLREVLPGDGVGPIVRLGAKTSFCLLDVAVYDATLPNFNPAGEFHSCATTSQGLSVGWMDIYDLDLDGQEIDITDVPYGTYWLESEVDPTRRVLESNPDNNVSRIKVSIGYVGEVLPDAYEPNDSIAAVNARSPGEFNSPNLGPCNPKRTITGLTLEHAGEVDYFKFYNPGATFFGDQVRINFQNYVADLDMSLLDANGNLVRTSSAGGDSEWATIPPTRGWYYVKVWARDGHVCPSYTLSIDPGKSTPPTITTLTPPAGNIELIHGLDAYGVEWVSSDPNGDPVWVTLFANTQPLLDGHEVLLPTSLNTPGGTGLHVLNSAYVEPGTYYIYAAATDGGTTVGSWSPGTVTFIENPHCLADFDNDGHVDDADFFQFMNAFNGGDARTDLNFDASIDDFDFFDFMNAFAAGC
ncbi:MAG: hypothetical protein JNM07_04460 [Phycisphaerae bacterium]|nr:hypothetical protein [Phycisphaerae bacterium]